MNRRTALPWILAAALLAVVAGLLWATRSPATPSIDADDATLVAGGLRIYRQHCASCHGRALEGQPEWRTRRADGRLPAPPHDASGHTWHHADAQLFGMVKEGFSTGRYAPAGYQSDMPAYGGILGDDEIAAVLAYIKSTWPAQQRAHQARVSQR